MSDETNTAGDEAAVNALFGDAESPPESSPNTPAPTETTTSADASPGESTAEVVDETPRAGYVPKAWRGDDGKFNGDFDGLFKSWHDGRQHVGALQARVKELEAANKTLVPETSADYTNTFDYAAFSAKAPNVEMSDDGTNAAVEDMLKAVHKAGIPVKKAQAFVTGYFEAVNEHLAPEEVKDEATLRKEAVAYLGPNGPQVMEDVKGFLTARARTMPFTKDQMSVLGHLMGNGPALSLLHSLARSGSSVAPPSAASTATVSPEQAKADARKLLGADNATWQAQKAEILAKARAAGLGE